jgi:hypothetical protein
MLAVEIITHGQEVVVFDGPEDYITSNQRNHDIICVEPALLAALPMIAGTPVRTYVVTDLASAALAKMTFKSKTD